MTGECKTVMDVEVGRSKWAANDKFETVPERWRIVLLIGDK
jgi:hypothetical protein